MNRARGAMFSQQLAVTGGETTDRPLPSQDEELSVSREAAAPAGRKTDVGNVSGSFGSEPMERAVVPAERLLRVFSPGAESSAVSDLLKVCASICQGEEKGTPRGTRANSWTALGPTRRAELIVLCRTCFIHSGPVCSPLWTQMVEIHPPHRCPGPTRRAAQSRFSSLLMACRRAPPAVQLYVRM